MKPNNLILSYRHLIQFGLIFGLIWFALTTLIQCATFTGMIPVFGVLLILFEWYWYVVCESGIRTSLILAQGNRWKCTAKAKHDWRSYVFRSQRSPVFTSARSSSAEPRNAAEEPAGSRIMTVRLVP